MFRIQAFVTHRVHVGTIKGGFRDVVRLLTCIQYRNHSFPVEHSWCQTQTGEHQLKVIAFTGRRDCFELLKSARTSVEFIKGTVWGRRFRQQRRVISVLGGLQPARV